MLVTACRTWLAGPAGRRYSVNMFLPYSTCLRPAMKKILAFALILVLACLFLDKIGASDMHMQFNGDDVDGPLEWLFGLVFAGGGLAIALIALLCAAVVVGVVVASVGLFMVAGIVIGGGVLVLVLLACSAPVLLPLLVIVGMVWLLSNRSRSQARARQAGL